VPVQGGGVVLLNGVICRPVLSVSGAATPPASPATTEPAARPAAAAHALGTEHAKPSKPDHGNSGKGKGHGKGKTKN
jgi:hypothetical protein